MLRDSILLAQQQAEINTGNERKHPIVLQSSLVNGTTDLTDFPVLITLDNLNSEVYNGGANSARSGGGDIIFTSDEAGLNRLSCEIVAFEPSATPANRKCQIWVKVPTLGSTSNTTIYIWYKHPTRNQPAVDAPFGRNSVWTKYDFYSHDGITDSSGNYVITQDNAATPTEFLDGGALTFNGTTYHSIDLGALNMETIRAVGVWAKQNGGVADRIVSFSGPSSPGDNIEIGTGVTGNGEFYGGAEDENTYGVNDFASSVSANQSLNTWHKLCLLLPSTNWGTGNHEFYVNNDAISAGSGLNYQNNAFNGRMTIGARNGGGSGHVDDAAQFYFTTQELTVDWIRTEYNNQSNASGFGISGTPVSDEF